MTTLRDELSKAEREFLDELGVTLNNTNGPMIALTKAMGGALYEALHRLAALANAPDPAGFTAADMMAARKEERERLQGGDGEAVSPEDRFQQFVAAEIARSPKPLQELGAYLTRVLDEDQWATANRLLLQLATTHPVAASVEVDESGGIVFERTQFKYPSETDFDSGIVSAYQSRNTGEWYFTTAGRPQFATLNFGSPPEFWILTKTLVAAAMKGS